jgi:uncharacterized protein
VRNVQSGEGVKSDRIINKKIIAYGTIGILMNSSRQDILSSLKSLKKHMAQEYAVKKIGVFGSVARNEQMEKSDIDLLVEFSRPVGMIMCIRLENFLSERLGKKVDLVTQDALKPVIRQEVLAEVIYV